MTRSVLSAIRAIAPELQEMVQRRYVVLRSVAATQPVGRRSLAERLGWPERMVRTEVDLLRDLGFVDLSSAGVVVSAAGFQLLDDLKEVVWEMHGLAELESQLADKFELVEAHVVPGDSEHDPLACDSLARAGADALCAALRPSDVLAVSGGSTMAAIAAQLKTTKDLSRVTVVPTGGGLGDRFEIEANTVATRMARALGAQWHLLHLQDDLGEEAVHAVLKANPTLTKMFELIRSARVVLHGIGSLDSVAARRGFDPAISQELAHQGAVGESLGYFFDLEGHIVRATSSVGLSVEDLREVDRVLVVAGGESKGEALVGVLSSGLQDVLVTDEAAARAVLRHLTKRD